MIIYYWQRPRSLTAWFGVELRLVQFWEEEDCEALIKHDCGDALCFTYVSPIQHLLFTYERIGPRSAL